MKIWDFHTEPPGPAISTRLKDRHTLGLPRVPAGRGPNWGLREDGSRKGLGEGLMPLPAQRARTVGPVGTPFPLLPLWPRAIT